jgi:hypothetical protein
MLVFLIILLVAAAGLVAWFLARGGAVDLRLPRLRESSLEGASPSGAAVPTVRGVGGHDSNQSDTGQRQEQGHKDRENRGEESANNDEAGVEQAVRDRLYGRYGRRD